jgi:hypothetical protein
VAHRGRGADRMGQEQPGRRQVAFLDPAEQRLDPPALAGGAAPYRARRGGAGAGGNAGGPAGAGIPRTGGPGGAADARSAGRAGAAAGRAARSPAVTAPRPRRGFSQPGRRQGQAAATHWGVSGPSGSTAGTAFSLTVTAVGPFGNAAAGYLGTVH